AAEIIPASAFPASTSADEISPAVRVIPARLNVDSVSSGRFSSGSAKPSTPLYPRKERGDSSGVPSRSSVLLPQAGRMARLVGAETVAAPAIEAVFVLIQGSNFDSFGQIQMWHVTVVRFVQAPALSTTPPRKT